MTVSSSTARNSYACNGSQTVFPYTFRILDQAHLQAVLRDENGNETVLTLTTHYTISGVDAAGGGNVTTVATYAAGYTIVLLRNVPLAQETDYIEYSVFPAESHEEALDKMMMVLQQMKEDVGRCFHVPRSSALSGSDLELNPIASMAIGWDSAAAALATYATTAVVATDFVNLHDVYGDNVSAAIAGIGSAQKTVVVDRNTAEIGTNLTSPANVSWLPINGAMFDIHSGVTFTVASPGNILASPSQRILTGAGVLAFQPGGGTLYPQWFGAKGDGATDDTAAIQAAFTAAGTAQISYAAGGVQYVGGRPTVYFKMGHYLISDTINPGTYVNMIGEPRAIIRGTNPAKDLLDFSYGYHVTISGFSFIGGKSQLRYTNTDLGAIMVVSNCEFTWNNSTYAVQFYCTGPATQLNHWVRFVDCKFAYLYLMMDIPIATIVTLENCVYSGLTTLTASAGQIRNKGSLFMDKFDGSPTSGTVPSGARWVDNYQTFHAVNSRFGSEGSGMPIVYQYEVAVAKAGYVGGSDISLTHSQLSCGSTGVENVLIRLVLGVPGKIVIRDNHFIAKGSASDFISIDGSFDVAAYIAALNANDHVWIDVGNNESYVPLESVGLPALLVNTDKNKVRVSPSFKPYIGGYTKKGLLHLDGVNASTNIVDEYFGWWTLAGGATLQTASKRFGSASLVLDGINDYLSNPYLLSLGAAFTLEGWFYTGDKTQQYQTICKAMNAGSFGLFLMFNNVGVEKMYLYASSNGTTWNLASASAGSKASWANNTWYKWVIEFTGAKYSVYIGEAGSAVTEDISVVTASNICAITSLNLGGWGANYLKGGMDEFRMLIGDYRYGGLFVPESQPFQVD